MAMPMEQRKSSRGVPTVDRSTPHGESTALLRDLDRCVHGRHRGDTCFDCGSSSVGNEFLLTGTRIGTGRDREAIVVPQAINLGDAAFWRQSGWNSNQVPEVIQKVQEERRKAAKGLEMVERVINLFGGRQDVAFSKTFTEIMGELYDERLRQTEKFGDQSHLPYGTSEKHREVSDKKREANKQAFREGRPTLAKILTEEFFEVMAEENEELLYKELTQLGAFCIQFMEIIRKKRERAQAENETGVVRIS